MPHTKAVVLDLDGTLLNSEKLISPRNRAAVMRCNELGIHVIVATARPPRAADKFIEGLPFVDYRVYYNGALVSCESKRIKRHISIPTEVSQQIINHISSSAPDAVVSFEVNDALYACAPVSDSQRSHLGLRPSDPPPELVKHHFIDSVAPTKILVLGYKSWNEIVESFGTQVNVVVTDGGTLVQVMHRAASKESGVQWALNEIEVSPEDVMVFGDDYNDLGLFRMCGFPVAMGNAAQDVKSNAKHITGSNDRDGVAIALEKFLV